MKYDEMQEGASSVHAKKPTRSCTRKTTQLCTRMMVMMMMMMKMMMVMMMMMMMLMMMRRRTRPTFVAYCFAVPRVGGGTLIGISPLCSYDGDDDDDDDDADADDDDDDGDDDDDDVLTWIHHQTHN